MAQCTIKTEKEKYQSEIIPNLVSGGRVWGLDDQSCALREHNDDERRINTQPSIITYLPPSG